VSFRAIARQFGVDERFVDDLREDLRFSGEPIAIEEHGFVWTAPAVGRAATPTSLPVPGIDVERRHLTVLLCDLVGSTDLSSRLDAEDLRTVMTGYQQACGEVIDRYGGRVAQYLGDGIVVYFGYPTTHEDDPARALHAALEIIRAVHAFGARAGRLLSVRVGVHTGAVVVGDVGGRDRREVLAVGETPNIAARLQAEAPRDGVLASDATWALAAGSFEGEDLGDRTLKGIGRPVRVHRVIAAREAPSPPRRVGGADLVGRVGELQQMLQRFEQVRGGRGGVVIVRGEPGIGKSRLAAALGEQLGKAPVLVVRGSSFHRHSSLFAFAEALAHGAGFLRDDGPDVRRRKLAAHLEARGLGDAESVSLLSALLGLAPAGPVAPSMSPQRQRLLTVDRLSAWLASHADRDGAVGLVEDLHWMDPTSIDLLAHVRERIGTVPLLLVLTTRPEGEPEWSAEDDVLRLELGRLPPHEARRLAGQAARTKPLESGALDQIVQRAEGIPLFLEELAREAASRAADPADGLPATLRGLLTARLDQAGTAKTVAQWGSVVGRRFGWDLLRTASGIDEETAREALARLIEADLLREEIDAGQPAWAFRHALIHEAAYDSLVRSARQQAHGRVADAIVARHPKLAEREPETVARHFVEAGHAQGAIEYCMRAGLRDIQQSANLEAIHHFSLALEQLARLPESPQRDELELQLRVLSAVPHTLTRGWAAPEVGAAYGRAQELCARLEQSPHLFPTLVGMLTFHIVRGDMARAREMGERHLEIAERSGDVDLLLEAHHDRGTTLFYTGDVDDALTHLQRAVDLYDPAKHAAHAFVYGKDPSVTARLHEAIGHALQGRPRRALEAMNDSVARARLAQHPFSLAWVLTIRAFLHLFRREAEIARREADDAVALSREQGFPNWIAQAGVYGGCATAILGRVDEGLAMAREGVALWLATGAELATSIFFTMIGDACLQAGRAEQARTALDEAIARGERTGERFLEPEALRLRAEAAHATGEDPSRVDALLAHAAAAAERMKARGLALRVATSRARLRPGERSRASLEACLAAVEPDDVADQRDARALLALAGDGGTAR